MFAALIASLTACFSFSVSFVSSATGVTAGFFNFDKSFSLTVLSAGISPVFPSLVLTLTLPLESTVMSFSVKPLFFAITAFFTASFSSSVRLLMSLTSVTAGSVNFRTESLALTVLSAGIFPTLPSWLMFTVPSSATVMSSSVKFLSGLAFLTASLTACFSSGVNLLVLSTRTGSFGGLKLF